MRKLLTLFTALLFVGSMWGTNYSGTFVKITSTAELTTGYYVIVASENASSNASYAMGSTVTDDKRISGVSVTISNGTTITDPNDAIVYLITKNGNNYTFKNVNTGNYMYQVSTTSGKGMGFKSTSENITLAGYNSESPKGFRFTLNGASTNYLKYNASSKWFANYANDYTTSMTPVRLFKLMNPEVDFTSKTIAWGDQKQNVAPAEKTFKLIGKYLSSGLTLTASTGYTVSPTSITKSDAMAADSVLITITPTTPTSTGANNGTITISGGGLASDSVINLTMNVNETYLVSTNVVVAGKDGAQGNTAKINNASSYYAEYAEEVTLTATQADGYVFVKWTTSDEDIVIGDEDSVKLSISALIGAAGTVTANFKAITTPTITVDETSLAFGSVDYKGSLAAKTFNVSGAALTAGKLSLASNSAAFTVDPAEIDVDGLLASTEITVTPVTTACGTFNGKITISGGSAEAQEVAVSLTVNRLAANLSWSDDSYTATIDDENTYPTLNNPRGLENIVYSSSDEDVATINANTGAITLVAAGETFIIANFAGNDTINPLTTDELFYTLTVQPKYTVTWNIDGVEKHSQTARAGAALTGIPDATKAESGAIAGKTFMGWATEEISGEVDAKDAPATSTPSVMPVGGADYYAVYATKHQGANVTHTLTISGKSSQSSYTTRSIDDDQEATWSGKYSYANETHIGLNVNNANYYLGSPVFEGKVLSVQADITNGSSKESRSAYLCSSNETSNPSSGDLGSCSVAASASDATTTFTLVENADFTQFYLYVSAALQFNNIVVVCEGAITYDKYATETVVPSSLEDVETSVKAVKVLRNGVLYIEKNGVRYNAMGQIIK